MFREKPIREGIPPFTIPVDVILPNMITNTIQDVKRNISFLQANINARLNATKAQITAVRNTKQLQLTDTRNASRSQATTKAYAKQGQATAKTYAKQGQATAMKISTKAEATAMKNAAKAESTAMRNKAELKTQAEVLHKKKAKSTMNIISRAFNIIKVVFSVFMFLGSVFTWCFKNITCGLEMLMNFKQCFFWYLLEIIGQTLYLPIRFLVWILGIQKWEKYTWDKIQVGDCAFYDLTGIHLIHYSEDILQRCYKCNPGPFPKWNIDLKVDLNPFSLFTGLF